MTTPVPDHAHGASPMNDVDQFVLLPKVGDAALGAADIELVFREGAAGAGIPLCKVVGPDGSFDRIRERGEAEGTRGGGAGPVTDPLESRV